MVLEKPKLSTSIPAYTILKHKADDTDEIDIKASFSWHFNKNTNQLLVAGVLKSDSNNFEKEVEASATYSVEGSVIDFTEKTGHIAIFEKVVIDFDWMVTALHQSRQIFASKREVLINEPSGADPSR